MILIYEAEETKPPITKKGTPEKSGTIPETPEQMKKFFQENPGMVLEKTGNR